MAFEIPMWTLESARTFIAQISAQATSAGWNLSLCGGVLNRGYSHHDLDLVATPRQVYKKSHHHFEKLKQLSLPQLLYIGERARWDNGVGLEYQYCGNRVDIITFNIVPWGKP